MAEDKSDEWFSKVNKKWTLWKNNIKIDVA